MTCFGIGGWIAGSRARFFSPLFVDCRSFFLFACFLVGRRLRFACVVVIGRAQPHDVFPAALRRCARRSARRWSAPVGFPRPRGARHSIHLSAVHAADGGHDVCAIARRKVSIVASRGFTPPSFKCSVCRRGVFQAFHLIGSRFAFWFF